MTKIFKIVSLFSLAAISGVATLQAGTTCSVASSQAKIAKADFPDIELGDLKQAIADGKVFLIDVNGSSSFREGHIPGAVDFASLGEKIASVLPEQKDAMIVAYCGGPSCGAYKQAAKAVAALGYQNVRHFSGGISGWKQAGEKTENAKS
jgi:rhodanese-related sulfurtransferase